ncbi:MAG: asparagine synthase B [Myxococcota bacterium]|jgi:asparagine synthase (glutamine-hydrolysing)|nr:asparagine synthase B [Myxococcota bacterium]
MCGILAVLGAAPAEVPALRKRVLRLQRRLRHRGPDWSGLHVRGTAVLAHERLAIVDPESGQQPLLSPDGKTALTVNGEIYNHRALRASLSQGYRFQTASDCEVILPLQAQLGEACVHELDGMFAFVLADERTGTFLAARDPIGVLPLYIGYGRGGTLWFASEFKALQDDCDRIEVFPPGHLCSSLDGEQRRWFRPDWLGGGTPDRSPDLDRLRTAAERAVVKRMMSDVPWGVLLSGGLDSSLVASIASRHADRRVEEDGRSAAWWPRMHTFSIGLPGCADHAAAQLVADHLGTVHHPLTFTIQEGLDALSDVVFHLETYDVTTIRASVPMYLMARKIRALGVKMVLSGEGADEALGGYLYFHRAPDRAELHRETLRKLRALHLYDCLRANKATAAWGVETRVPFLDLGFLQEVMTIDPLHKMSSSHPEGPRMEKQLLRQAFDVPDSPYLPAEVLWRQKEQFSDGVGYGWIDALRQFARDEVGDALPADAASRFPRNTPASPEEYLYRCLFEEHFPHRSAAATVPGGASIACSCPEAIGWDPAFARSPDPSGRAVTGIHRDSR